MADLCCFVIMPFREEYDTVYRAVSEAVADAVPGQPIVCSWLKDVHAAGRITDDIVAALRGAALCIADVSDCNPNVMWETGFAMALSKPTLLIGRDCQALPFDLLVHRVLLYSPQELHNLRARLAEAVRQTLARYEIRPAPSAARSQPAGATIAVTGTMRADPAKTARRVETLLRPFLDSEALWYCGSQGVVDKRVLDYLAVHQQRAVAVGYHRFDASPRVRDWIDGGRVSFCDASVESVPKPLAGPSERDALFCARADLVVLFWDGASRGTEE